jgi:MarR family transcriptional regulator, lower aerobic nicotinate degradation pathway regulator
MTATARDHLLVDGLFQLSFLLHGALARIAATHEISLVQARLLAILRDREPLMSELAKHLELEKSSLSGLVDRAEERGLVERVASTGDGRATSVRVTTRGRRLSRALENEVTVEVAALTSTLSRSDREQLASLVRRIVAKP